MRRSFGLVVLPLMLFALEKVNLIKDGGFEKKSEVWIEVAGGESPTDTAIANRHDDEKAFSGFYSGSCNTRIPGQYPIHGDSALLIQEFPVAKTVSNLDSFLLKFLAVPKDNRWDRSEAVEIVFCINSQDPDWQYAHYIIKAADIFIMNPPSYLVVLDTMNFPQDTNWHSLIRNVKMDLLGKNVLPDSKIDRFFLASYGFYIQPWRGQKAYFDDIRLTGYADYDVGVKEVMLGVPICGSLGYAPVARIKNFGRMPAQNFLVIAKMERDSTLVYADTLDWWLEADTEDTVDFKAFIPSESADYILTVSTIMPLDESDEDDEMSETFNCSGTIESPTSSPSLILDVVRNTPFSLLVSFSIPDSEQGTISLYDPTGRRVESLHVQGEGSVSLKTNPPSGVYFIKLEAKNITITRKAVILH